jgi:hypothetical protein
MEQQQQRQQQQQQLLQQQATSVLCVLQDNARAITKPWQLVVNQTSSRIASAASVALLRLFLFFFF